MITHEEISKRAREIWEREGRPEGQANQHWMQAEAELRKESAGSSNGPAVVGANTETLSAAARAVKENGARKRTARRSK